jgi:atypical dual specificity phosphatase
MAPPVGFTWIDKPLLGALAFPEGLEDLVWLRQQGIQLLLSLSEDPPPRGWVNEAGLMLVHFPVEDMEAPTQEQLVGAISAIRRAHDHDMGVAVHCTAGLGRTGVILACHFVTTGLTSRDAIARVRRMRPGSIETTEQAAAVSEFARRHSWSDQEGQTGASGG